MAQPEHGGQLARIDQILGPDHGCHWWKANPLDTTERTDVARAERSASAHYGRADRTLDPTPIACATASLTPCIKGRCSSGPPIEFVDCEDGRWCYPDADDGGVVVTVTVVGTSSTQVRPGASAIGAPSLAVN